MFATKQIHVHLKFCCFLKSMQAMEQFV